MTEVEKQILSNQITIMQFIRDKAVQSWVYNLADKGVEETEELLKNSKE